MVTTAQPAGPTRTTWVLDPAHTLVEFSAKHLVFTTVKGRFTGVSGTIALDEQNLANSSVEVTIDAATLDSRQEQRDSDLRSANFLDVEHFPTITFRSMRVEPQGGDRLKVFGDLTIRGVTREVALDTSYNGRVVAPWGTEVASFSAATQINRKDFGLTLDIPLEGGGLVVGEAIKIAIEAEASAASS